MDNNYWHSRIEGTIDKCSYEFYVVHPIESIKCTCVNQATKQADPTCINCLGTGNKIKIRKIKGASNDLEVMVAGKGVRGSAAQTVGRTYFIKNKYPIGDTDMIIDKDEIFNVYRVFKKRGMEGYMTHNQVTAVPKRNDHAIVLQNFRKIMKKFGK